MNESINLIEDALKSKKDELRQLTSRRDVLEKSIADMTRSLLILRTQNGIVDEPTEAVYDHESLKSFGPKAERFGKKIYKMDRWNGKSYTIIYQAIAKEVIEGISMMGPNWFDAKALMPILRHWYPNLTNKSLAVVCHGYAQWAGSRGVLEIKKVGRFTTWRKIARSEPTPSDLIRAAEEERKLRMQG